MKIIIYQLIICLVFSIFVLPFDAMAQNKTKNSKKIKSPVVVKNKSGVYVSFERFGKRVPLRENEKGDGAWLRLNNNMLYSISVCIFGISDKAELFMDSEKNTQVGIEYDVLLNPISETDQRPIIDVPIGYNTDSVCQIYTIKSGKSLMFAVPLEHLVKGLSIKIPFNYGWEEEMINNPMHFVYFNSLSLPK